MYEERVEESAGYLAHPPGSPLLQELHHPKAVGKEDNTVLWEGVSMAWKTLGLLPERMPCLWRGCSCSTGD